MLFRIDYRIMDFSLNVIDILTYHLTLKLSQYGVTLRAVAFGAAEWAKDLVALDCPIDVAFRPVINTFRGRRKVELHLVDWRVGT